MPALGRRIEHDPRSRNYLARGATQPRTVLWTHSAPVLDQGDLGSCTGNALAQCLNAAVFAPARPHRRYLTETNAVALYSEATRRDEFWGQYPPDDDGSSGLGVAKAGVALGYLSAYKHAFGFAHALAVLAVTPVIVGTRWDNDMFEPDARGFLHLGGGTAGGHEYVLLGVSMKGQYVTILNSWGQGWGVNGRARITFDDFNRLLMADGDVTVPIGRSDH